MTDEHAPDETSPDPEVDRAVRLFRYLRDLSELRTRVVRDHSEYEETVWFHSMPADPKLYSPFLENGADPENETWLEVERVLIDRPPPIPSEIEPWIRQSGIGHFERDEPGMRERDEDEPTPPPEVVTAYRRYVDSRWTPWAVESRRRRPIADFYRSLFQISQRRDSLGEIYELVVGIGLLSWRRGGHAIRRHTVTTPVEISVDPATGQLTVGSTETEGRTRIELDMLEMADRGPGEAVSSLVSAIESADPMQLPIRAIEGLRSWVNVSHPDGSVHASLEPMPPGDDLTISTAPAIILRKRNQRTLNELLDGIARYLEAQGQLPDNVRSLVSSSGASTASSGVSFEDSEIYFPLPSNEEQRTIIERMRRQRGVLVQGPPGTGKSHTIANLMAHLLAQGKRVLVTSHTERALRVLRDKLPEDIQPLCIALLGGDRESIKELESSIGWISSRQSSWTPELSERTVEALRSELDEARRKQASLLRRLREIRELDTVGTTIGGYSGTSMQIARQLSSERRHLGWIADQLVNSDAPLSSREFDELLDLLWSLPPDADMTAQATLPAESDLISSDEAESLFAREADLEQDRTQAIRRFGDWLAALDGSTDDEIQSAQDALGKHLSILDSIESSNEWAVVAARDVAAGRGGTWRALLDRVGALHREIGAAMRTATLRVEIPGESSPIRNRAAVRALIGHVQEGRKLRTGLLATGAAREHREILESLRVDGARVESLDQLRVVEAQLTIEIALGELGTAWDGKFSTPSSGPLAVRCAAFEQELLTLEAIGRFEECREQAEAALRRLTEAPPPNWLDRGDVGRITSALRAASRYREATAIRARIDAAFTSLGSAPHASVEALREALRARSGSQFRAALSGLRAAREVGASARRRLDLIGRLEEAPSLRTSLLAGSQTEWNQRRGLFEAAWGWARAHTELSRLLDPGEAPRLNRELLAEERRERAALSGLAAQLSWSRMFDTLTPNQSMALAAWTTAVRRIGRGKGKYAAVHRRTARTYMAEARHAIPAWIMPIYRVAESVDVVPEPFDVVIIDEASQSGVEALFLMFLAKQVVVVGDDEQIAPEAVGINRENVLRLQRQHLEGLPYGELFEPETSLFDQANIRFVGNRIRLREHFRCMPEIIEFSNRLSYSDQPLIPMRQYGADRLGPIKTVFRSDGYREGRTRAINRPEAEEIVARIEMMCADPTYDEKSIGVISLQGDHQARLIETMLLSRLGPQRMSEREITCGDAYAFQGDERDVMFLSLVAAPNARIGSLSKMTDRRRFNVAASRAKDQVWLVHSATLNDLGSTDVRRSLLEYYLAPEIEHLEELGEFDTSIVNEPFDSRFEQDVYLDIRRRRYRVIPQVEQAGYRIDLVIEGGAKRLAVECDGDEWHGAEAWESDAGRQRTLERAGWTFVRIRGSAYYRDPATAMQPVWEACDRLGIIVGSGLSGEGSTVEAPIGIGEPDPTTAPDFGLHPDDETADDIGRLRGGADDSIESPDVITRESSSMSNDEPLDRDVARETNDSGRHAPENPTTPGGLSESDTRFLEAIQRHAETPGDTRSVPPASPRFGSSRGRVSLKPYIAWSGSGLVDPREAHAGQVAASMLPIIETEGPISTDRLYSVFIQASGSVRVTRQARSALNAGLNRLLGKVELAAYPVPGTNWPQRVLRVVDSPEIVLRELGPRDMYHVPLDEVALLMNRVEGLRRVDQEEDLMREVLGHYGLVRLTERVREFLRAARDIERGPGGLEGT